MSEEQIRDYLLAKAREVARAEGRDVEVTSVAFDLACARIAELEGACAKAMEDDASDEAMDSAMDGDADYFVNRAAPAPAVAQAEAQDTQVKRLLAHLESLADAANAVLENEDMANTAHGARLSIEAMQAQDLVREAAAQPSGEGAGR